MARISPRTRLLQWSTGSGPVILAWPEVMSPDDAAEAVLAVNLALRNIERLATVALPFDDYGAAMTEAFGVVLPQTEKGS